MSDRHITDEEIHGFAGQAPREPKGLPQATCLNCRQVHTAYYASQAHDCFIDLTARRPYSEWLVDFQKWGYGVLRTPEDTRFPNFEYVISGRQMLTFHLQSDLFIGPDYTLRQDWYFGDPWHAAGFPEKERFYG